MEVKAERTRWSGTVYGWTGLTQKYTSLRHEWAFVPACLGNQRGGRLFECIRAIRPLLAFGVEVVLDFVVGFVWPRLASAFIS
jgi:hypothetical protein